MTKPRAPKRVWINVYPDTENLYCYDSRANAKTARAPLGATHEYALVTPKRKGKRK